MSKLYLRWLEACIYTPSYSMSFNGSIHGYFKSKRGLRQDDPLFPCIYVLSMNCLSWILSKATMEGKIGYHHKCEETRLTHLCFVDDLLIFIEGKLDSIKNILQILKEFEDQSGLALNIQKQTSFQLVYLQKN